MTVLAGPPPHAPSFPDDLTPGSGLAPRRWTPGEFARMASSAIFGPEERLEPAGGEIILRGTGVPRLITCGNEMGETDA